MAKTSEMQQNPILYDADEKPAFPLAFGLGLQIAILISAGVVLTPAIVVTAGGGTEDFKEWAVFVAVVICGLTTILQAVRIGHIGAGYILAMGTSGAFIAICVTAIAKGGAEMLGTLVAISALFQFAIATKLSLLRRILTPTVAGTVIMLIPVTVMPILFSLLESVTVDTTTLVAPLCAITTLAVTIAVAFKASGNLRLWAPVIGVAIGSLIGGYFGIYKTELVINAAWFGIPEASWPGLDLSFGPIFWSLLPGFIIVTLVGATETIGDSVAIQRVSWKEPRAIDFRAVQGAVAADGVGNLLSGLAVTVPNTTYSTSVAVVELTGVAARRVGIVLGIILLVAAFCPKLIAVILAIPDPVVAAFATILISMLFVLGMKIIVEDSLDYKKGLIAGISFWLGVGFQNGAIFPEHIPGFLSGILDNGMTAGAIAAITMTLFLEVTEPRRKKIQLPFTMSELPKIRTFLNDFASSSGWGNAMCHRLDAVAEETMLSLLQHQKDENKTNYNRQLLLTAKRERGQAILEFIAATDEKNLEDRMALIGEKPHDGHADREISLRLLRHLASSVSHQQYNDADIVTIRVDAVIS